MRCKHCDAEPGTESEPSYCPNCGEEWARKGVEDVDWPIETSIAPRPDIARRVSMQTGIEYDRVPPRFPDETEIIVPIRIYEDGSYDVFYDDE